MVVMRMAPMGARLSLGCGSHWPTSRIEVIRKRLELRKRLQGDGGLCEGVNECRIESGSL